LNRRAVDDAFGTEEVVPSVGDDSLGHIAPQQPAWGCGETPRSQRNSNSRYSNGDTSNVRTVLEISPLMTTIANGFCTSAGTGDECRLSDATEVTAIFLGSCRIMGWPSGQQPMPLSGSPSIWFSAV
jgi:hypothetical protein